MLIFQLGQGVYRDVLFSGFPLYVNTTLSDNTCINLVSRLASVWVRWAVTKANNMVNFLASCFRVNFLFPGKDWRYLRTVPTSQGGTRSIHDGGSDGASYCKPKKIHKPEILDPKNTWQQNFQPKKIQDLNTSILIYSIKQNFLMHDFASISL